MMNRKITELIQGEIDGVNSPQDSLKIQEVLDKDEQARALYQDLMTVDRKLKNLRLEKHEPVDLVSDIRSKINDRLAQRAGETVKPEAESRKPLLLPYLPASGILSGKMAASIAAILIITVTVVFLSLNLPQPETGQVAGTIGMDRPDAAMAAPLTGVDVISGDKHFREVLGLDAFQALLQSGELQQLAASASFVKFMRDASVQDLFRDGQMLEWMQSEAAIGIMRKPLFPALLGEPAMQDLLRYFAGNTQYTGIMFAPQAAHLLQNKDFQVVMQEPSFHFLIGNETFADLAQNTSFPELMQSGDFIRLMRDVEFLAILRDASLPAQRSAAGQINNEQGGELPDNVQFAGIFKEPAARELLLHPAIIELFNHESFLKLMRYEQFIELIQAPGFRHVMIQPFTIELMRNPGFPELMGMTAFSALVKHPAFPELAKETEFLSLLRNPGLHKQYDAPDFVRLLRNENFKRLIHEPTFTRLLVTDGFYEVLRNDENHLQKPVIN